MALTSDQKVAEAAAEKRKKRVEQGVAAALLFVRDRVTVSIYWAPDLWDEFRDRLRAALEPVSSASDEAARAVFAGYDSLDPATVNAQAMARDVVVSDIDAATQRAVSKIVAWVSSSGLSESVVEDVLTKLAGLNANQISPIITQLSAMASTGASEAEIVKAAAKAASGAIEDRAAVIAGDALWSGVQQGRMSAGKQEQRITNALVTKTWRTVGDEFVCEICGPLDGIKVGIDDYFPGGFKMPGAHPKCRCHTDIETEDPE